MSSASGPHCAILSALQVELIDEDVAGATYRSGQAITTQPKAREYSRAHPNARPIGVCTCDKSLGCVVM